MPQQYSDTADHAVMVFLKFPEKGRVKTRLACAIGDDAALAIYRAFVLDTLAMLKVSAHPLVICFHPPEAEDAVVQWLGEGYRFQPQTGRDLGERMANAFDSAFSDGFSRVLLMGTDIPDLPPPVIGEAFGTLHRHPAVIGPSADGGYYLIGFARRGYLPACFRNIPWSTRSVLRQTLARMATGGVSCHMLPPWRDIDEWEDLKTLISRADLSWENAPATMRCAASMGLLSSPHPAGCGPGR